MEDKPLPDSANLQTLKAMWNLNHRKRRREQKRSCRLLRQLTSEDLQAFAFWWTEQVIGQELHHQCFKLVIVVLLNRWPRGYEEATDFINLLRKIRYKLVTAACERSRRSCDVRHKLASEALLNRILRRIEPWCLDTESIA